eukprot:4088369-Pyramimonas_sp.AAC.1
MRIRVRGRWGRRQFARLWRSPPKAPKSHKLYNEPAAGADLFVKPMWVGRGWVANWSWVGRCWVA